MEKVYKLAGVKVVLYDGMLSMRHMIGEMLHSIGFQSVCDFGDLDDARKEIPEMEPDLLILDLDHGRDAVCAAIRDIRHGLLGANPFPVVIVYTWQLIGGTVGCAMEAGADDIVGLPLSIQLIREQIENMIRNRKVFVVATGYVGPDRRCGFRLSGDVFGRFAVPNGLRHKATGDPTAAASEDAIRRATQTICEHRLHRLTDRVNALASTLESQAQSRDTIELPRDVIDELSELLKLITGHLEAQGTANLVELAFSMRGVMADVVAAPSPSMGQLELLKLHGQAVAATLQDRKNAGKLVLAALGQTTQMVNRKAS